LKISVGIDNGDGSGIAGDNLLQTGEIDQTSYLCTPYTPKRAFVSSTVVNGAFGGLAQADAICQAAANAVGLGGSYKAWLSDATASPATRFTRSLLPYALVDGTRIADNWADLVSGSLNNRLHLTETGVAYSDYVYTATTNNGTYFGGWDCNGWTTTAADARVGYSPDENQWSGVGTISCGEAMRLYCFEQ
jgi:hypothetical protein